MIDFHTHILPGMDDGSEHAEESVEMLRLLKRQGVETVVATSHFYGKRTTPEKFLQRRARSVQALREEVRSRDIAEEMPEIILGAEVHYFSGISRSESICKLAIEGTDLLLLELPFGIWNESIIEEVEAIHRNLGLQVVLAHLERYYAIGKNKGYIQQLLELDVLVQVNIDTFLSFRTSRRVVKLLLEERIYALCSDCHNMKERKPKWEEFLAYIDKKNLGCILDRMENKNRF